MNTIKNLEIDKDKNQEEKKQDKENDIKKMK